MGEFKLFRKLRKDTEAIGSGSGANRETGLNVSKHIILNILSVLV